jgi:signal transduction histidine kinase/DNA-binding response OmpR family regulator
MRKRVLGLAAVPRSALVVGTGVVFLVVICAFAYLLVDSQSRLREESEKRFQSRAAVSAAMTDALFATASAQQQEAAAKAFGGRVVSTQALAEQKRQSRYGYAFVLDERGQLLGASTDTPDRVRRRIQRLAPHVRMALAGRSYLSVVLPGVERGSDVIEWALPFDSRFGRRLEVVALRTKEIGGFLGRYLARGRDTPRMDAHLVDSNGRLIAAASGGGGVRDRKDIAVALSDGRGTYREGETERYVASAPVAGSSWRMVVSEPTRDLYPLLAAGRTWLLWGVLVAFAAAAAASLVLFRRVLRTAAQLGGANARLEKRQQELGLANEKLESQTRLAQDASRAKSAFLANMSHELRTPLNAIIGFSELMMNGTGNGTEAERREYLGHVITSGRHLEQLVNDILDLSKVEAGKMEFHPEPVALKALIGDLTSTMQVLADRKRIELVIEVAPEVESVVADPARLKQVLYNYLSNALKFTPEQGSVTIRVGPEGSQDFRLAVEDTGIGIAPEDQHRLFNEFEQLDQSVRKEHQGTGLGLALVKRIVEAQGGTVGMRSTQGEGSVFHAVLPRLSQGQERAERASLPRVEANGSPAVLVVEDDPNDQALLERILSPAGYAVEIASTGAEAVKKACERHFDAVVLDLILPDASGLDVLQSIREKGKNPAARTVVVTMVREEGIGKAFAVNEWLVKPVARDQLLLALERAGIRSGAGTVLVVDDDASSLKMAEATIKQLGCKVICAGGGEEGLEAAAAYGPLAAIVLDLLMPGIDGFQFLERLRSTDHGEQTPVIVWTSRDLSADEQAILLQGAQGLVGKGQRGAYLVDELKPFLAGVPNGR